jgi:hypothetical protein
MSIVAEYRSTQQAIKELQERLETMHTDDRLQRELEFEEKLRLLMSEYSKSLRDIRLILDPEAGKGTQTGKGAQAAAPTRKPRKTKTYVHPETGEHLETKGGNHSKLKEWKAEYGSDVVESWLK